MYNYYFCIFITTYLQYIDVNINIQREFGFGSSSSVYKIYYYCNHGMELMCQIFFFLIVDVTVYLCIITIFHRK